VPVPRLTLNNSLRCRCFATTPNGCTYRTLRALGVSLTDTDELVAAEYAIAKRGSQRAGGRTMRITRFVITGAGRRAIG
jgi:hypothetical protein